MKNINSYIFLIIISFLKNHFSSNQDLIIKNTQKTNNLYNKNIVIQVLKIKIIYIRKFSN